MLVQPEDFFIKNWLSQKAFNCSVVFCFEIFDIPKDIFFFEQAIDEARKLGWGTKSEEFFHENKLIIQIKIFCPKHMHANISKYVI